MENALKNEDSIKLAVVREPGLYEVIRSSQEKRGYVFRSIRPLKKDFFLMKELWESAWRKASFLSKKLFQTGSSKGVEVQSDVIPDTSLSDLGNDTPSDVSHAIEEAIHKSSEVFHERNDIREVDFQAPQHCNGSAPVYCIIDDEELYLPKRSWGSLVIAFIEKLNAEQHPGLQDIYQLSAYGKDPLFLAKPLQKPRQFQLSNGYWINLYFSASAHVLLLKTVCKYCDISLDRVVIGYRLLDENNRPKEMNKGTEKESKVPPRKNKREALAEAFRKELARYEEKARSRQLKTTAEKTNQNSPKVPAFHEETLDSQKEERSGLPASDLLSEELALYQEKTESHCTLDEMLPMAIPVFSDESTDVDTDTAERTIPKFSMSDEQPSDLSDDAYSEAMLLDFQHPKRTSFTKPVACHFRGEELALEKESWACLFLTIVEQLIDEDHPELKSLQHTPLKGRRPFFLPEKDDAQCRPLSNGKWLNLRLSAPDIVRHIKRLFKHCTIDLEELEIHYQPRDVDQQPPLAEAPDLPLNPADLKVLDFNDPESVTFTSPVSFHVFGKELALRKISWAQVLVALVEYLIDQDYPELKTLEEMPLRGKELLFESRQTKRHRHQLSNGKWLHLRNGPIGIVIMVKRLCAFCDIPLENIEIQYLPSDKKGAGASRKQRISTFPVAPPKIEIDPELKEALCKILSEKFIGGFQLNSMVECMRFRKVAQSLEISILPEENEALDAAIATCGVQFEGKVFVIPPEVTEWLLETLTQAQEDGVDLIYYKTFYRVHEDWLHTRGVHRSTFLKQLLIKLSLPKKIFFKKKYCSLQGKRSSEMLAICNEILRIWKEEEQMINYGEIARRLPYIPLKKVKQCLGVHGQFIWVKKDHYTHQSRILMSEEDIRNLQEFVREQCRRNQFIPVRDLPMTQMEEDNYSLSRNALEDAAFQIALSEEFKKDGSIISLKGEKLTTTVLVTELCSAQSQCSLRELRSYYQELTGKQRHDLILTIAHSTKIRIDEDTFVSESRIHFDVKQIDSILDRMISGDFIPLQDVKTFTSFPACGSRWNLFLLESYCNRFSEQFHYDVLAFNSANVGVIIRKNASLSYHEVMVHALAASDIILEKKNALEYLFDRGYLGRRSYKKINALLEYARQLRQKRK